MKEFLLKKDGVELGPFTWKELRTMRVAGEIADNDWVRKVDVSNWEEAKSFFETRTMPRHELAETRAKVVTEKVNSSVPDYLIASALASLFLCFPLGVVSLIYSLKAELRVVHEKYDEARVFAKKAKLWLIFTVVLGLLLWSVVVFSYLQFSGAERRL